MSHFKNPEFAKAMTDLGFKVGFERKNATIQGRIGAAIEYTNKVEKLPTQFNQGKISDLIERSDYDNELGGSYYLLKENLAGKIDMEPFLKERAKIENSELMRRLVTSTANLIPKRRRFMSEHDGEWDQSRQWEISPFAATKKVFAPGKVITVYCNFSIAWHASASDIDRYGAMAWSLCDIIEKSGVMTRVVWVNNSSRINDRGDCAGSIEIELKKPGEYISPSLFATAFKSYFYRRIGFSLIAAQAELCGDRVDHAIGGPIREPQAIKFENGILRISPDVLYATNDKLEEEILKSVGAFKQVGAA